MAREREQIYRDWFTVRMNSKGWYDLGERVEILWGPDYRDRYDVYVFRDNRIERRFAKLPGDFGLPVVDQRREIKVFDAEKAYEATVPTRRAHARRAVLPAMTARRADVRPPSPN